MPIDPNSLSYALRSIVVKDGRVDMEKLSEVANSFIYQPEIKDEAARLLSGNKAWGNIGDSFVSTIKITPTEENDLKMEDAVNKIMQEYGLNKEQALEFLKLVSGMGSSLNVGEIGKNTNPNQALILDSIARFKQNPIGAILELDRTMLKRQFEAIAKIHETTGKSFAESFEIYMNNKNETEQMLLSAEPESLKMEDAVNKIMQEYGLNKEQALEFLKLVSGMGSSLNVEELGKDK